jgi:hypothetical protein
VSRIETDHRQSGSRQTVVHRRRQRPRLKTDPLEAEPRQLQPRYKPPFVPDSVEVGEGRADLGLDDVRRLLPRRAPRRAMISGERRRTRSLSMTGALNLGRRDPASAWESQPHYVGNRQAPHGSSPSIARH